MKRLLLLAGLLIVAAAAMPSTASAWTHCGTPQAESDCPPITVCVDGQVQQLPDNGYLPPGATRGECPAPPSCDDVAGNEISDCQPPPCPFGNPRDEQTGECGPIIPPPPTPEQPTPPAPPEQQPGPPVQPEQPNLPDHGIGVPVHVDKPNLVLGEEQEGKPVPVSNPVEVAGEETLPFTGLNLLIVAGLGGAFLALGAWGRRATREGAVRP